MTDAPTNMSSHRPYLLRALWEWIADNAMTPHVLVDAQWPGVRVPPHTVKDGRVVLNIADRAVAHLQMGNEAITFSARFGGVSQQVSVPVGAVLAIYARETGQGMALPDDMAAGGRDTPLADDGAGASPAPGAAGGGPHLTLATENTPASDAVVSDHEPPPDDGDDTPPPRRGGHLRVVK